MDVYRHEWRAADRVKRSTVDLSAYPDLVIMYLGLRAHGPRGVLTTLKFIRRIRHAVREEPDGLLLHEPILFLPSTFGLRQYWRDFDSLEAWAGRAPHRDWWKAYLADAKGTSLWHETYFMRGGVEAIYDNVETPTGLMRFAEVAPAEGGLFNARMRARHARRPGRPGDEPPNEETTDL